MHPSHSFDWTSKGSVSQNHRTTESNSVVNPKNGSLDCWNVVQSAWGWNHVHFRHDDWELNWPIVREQERGLSSWLYDHFWSTTLPSGYCEASEGCHLPVWCVTCFIDSVAACDSVNQWTLSLWIVSISSTCVSGFDATFQRRKNGSNQLENFQRTRKFTFISNLFFRKLIKQWKFSYFRKVINGKNGPGTSNISHFNENPCQLGR